MKYTKYITIVVISIATLTESYAVSGDTLVSNYPKYQVRSQDSVLSYFFFDGDWKLTEREITQAWNIAGNITSALSFYLNESDEIWYPKDSISILYHPSEMINRYITFPWNSIDNEWDDTCKFFEYIEFGNSLVYFSRSRDYLMNTFTGGYLMNSAFDQDHNISERIDRVWNSNDCCWKLFAKYNYSYQDGYLSECLIYNHDTVANEWVQTIRKQYYQDQFANYDIWDSTQEIWSYNTRVNFNFQNGLIAQERWIDYNNDSYTYDSYGHVLSKTRKVWDISASSWKNLAQYTYQNDSFGNKLQELFLLWNVESNDWDSISKKVYYWTDYTFESVRDNNFIDIKINPIPATDRLYISSREGFLQASIEIYNCTGRLMTATVIDKSNTIDISGLDAGVYIIKIDTENIHFVSKFIKQ